MHDDIPNRIILSRKGWDSKAGGKPSPLLPDGTLVMLPIPDSKSGIRYGNLLFPDGRSIGPVVEALTRGRLSRNNEVHLDPDIDARILKRSSFRAAFGQCGGAQSHLENQGVTQDPYPVCGDLFIFFGLYREVEHSGRCWRYRRNSLDLHVMFGWLQIGDVVKTARHPVPEIAARHPHAIPSQVVVNELGNRSEDNNTIYLARPKLSFFPTVAGAGMFGSFSPANLDDPRRLSKPNQTQASLWRLPSFFSALSNVGGQPAPVNGEWYPQRRGPGQEFVLDTTRCKDKVTRWLEALFATVSKTASAHAGM